MIENKKITIIGLTLILLTIITMGLFNLFSKKNTDSGQFLSSDSLENKITKQLQMTPKIMEQLRKLKVTSDKELKLEYFFYTNTEDKAQVFASELKKIEYTVKYGVSAGDKKLFVVTGWTTKIRMADDVVMQWTRQMCELGYKFDCDFDGWGTEPDQK